MLWLIAIKIFSNKTINEIMPPFGMKYTLTQTKQKSYSNIDECLLNEIALPRDKTQNLIDEYRNSDEWQIIKDRDISDFLKDETYPLSEDEKFAISLYSAEPFFYNTLSEVLNLGVTAYFNCYFQYLRSGFDKIKSPLIQKTTLYRGVSHLNELVHYKNYKKNDIVYTTSFTSTSLDPIVAFRFAGSRMLFIINALRNPKPIIALSFYPGESELLYPPATKFKVIDDPYEMYCTVDSDLNYYDCQETEVDSYYEKYTIVPLEELDEDYGPITTIENGENEKEANNDCDHLGVPWWGWLLVGFAVGAILIGIIWILVFCFCNNNSLDMNSKNEIP